MWYLVVAIIAFLVGDYYSFYKSACQRKQFLAEFREYQLPIEEPWTDRLPEPDAEHLRRLT